MNQYFQKLRVLYEKVKNIQNSYEKVGIKPARDWKMMLVSSGIIFCICAVLGFVFYVKVDTGKFFKITDQSAMTEVKINDQLLKKTVEEINKREYTLEALRLNKTAPKDPSM